MSSNITLSAGVRQNLMSLQQTADLMSLTQNRLATGKKVNTALDNPANFFTSVSLHARSADLGTLLDSMSNGIKTLEAADNGIKAISNTVEAMKSVVRQARQDKSQSVTPGSLTATGGNTSTATNNELTFELGGGVSVAIETYTQAVNATVTTVTSSGGVFTGDLSAAAFSIDDGTGAVAITFAASDDTVAEKITAINADLAAAGSTVLASDDGSGQITLTNSTGLDITIAADAASEADLGFTNGTVADNGTAAVAGAVKALQDIVDAINTNSTLTGKVQASIDANGDLVLENLTTTAYTVTGHDGTDVTGDSTDSQTLAAGTAATTSNIRQSLANQFADLKTQLDKLAEDASFNGINLLAGDKLKLNFNETGTSFIEIQGKKADNTAFGKVSSVSLGLDITVDFSDDTSLDTALSALGTASVTLRTQASQYGTNLITVQNRQEFTKSMMNTLETGADNLVLADINEEGANMLALQTRQQLSTTALALSAQADQAVLRLF